MFKKFLKISFVFIMLFYFFIDSIIAYEFYDRENENDVNDLIREIYDAKEQYEDLVGVEEVEKNIIKTSSNLFWWPIGSKETEKINGVLYAKGEPESIIITSNYGSKEDFRTSEHGGIDIGSAGNGPGVVNVIAAKSGEVVYPKNKSQTQYSDNGSLENKDGGGFGNYIKIKHSDGTYTIYAHLAQNSITVMAGDVVDQGQVIAKLGHSGQSTGPHLHFEVRVGSDAKESRVYPLDYVDPKNPRPMSSGSGNDFSLTTTSLSKEEFVAKMRDYYKRSGNENFNKNFLKNAEKIYDVSLSNNVNPELVVVTAKTEQGFINPCSNSNNYWGIGVYNGGGCNAANRYSSIYDGIAGYADTLSKYNEGGSQASLITSRYNDRSKANCDSAGHGLPGTFAGMQSVYSWLGYYRTQEVCTYLNSIYGKNYCSVANSNKKTTVCEQNDYTAWQIKQKVEVRYDIFGI